MKQLQVDKTVLAKAAAIVKENEGKDTFDLRPMPVVTFEYPLHGEGRMTVRFVRVVEMDETHLKGFEVQNEWDEEPGKYKVFRLNLMRGGGDVRLLHLAPPTDE